MAVLFSVFGLASAFLFDGNMRTYIHDPKKYWGTHSDLEDDADLYDNSCCKTCRDADCHVWMNCPGSTGDCINPDLKQTRIDFHVSDETPDDQLIDEAELRYLDR